MRIPKTHPVQPLKPGEHAEAKATCGHCGLSWDDAKVTSMTPAPSACCPFEAFHDEGEEDDNRCAWCGQHVDAAAQAAQLATALEAMLAAGVRVDVGMRDRETAAAIPAARAALAAYRKGKEARP